LVEQDYLKRLAYIPYWVYEGTHQALYASRIIMNHKTAPIYKDWEDRDGDNGIRAMCDYGAKHRTDQTLEFECFNRSERDAVHEYMDKAHPGVPFVCSYHVFEKEEPDAD
jgi:hypothetical protein